LTLMMFPLDRKLSYKETVILCSEVLLTNRNCDESSILDVMDACMVRRA